MDNQNMRHEVLDAAKQCAMRGAGYAQQRVVLDKVAEKYRNGAPYSPLDIKLQQAILTCWHDLFRDGDLSWGYDLDNPEAPFFHLPDRSRPKA